MKVGVLEKINCIEIQETTQKLLVFLTSLGYETKRFSTVEEIDGVDVVVVLGGDGAILHAAVTAARHSVQIIGVNYGNLGFLTEFEKYEWEKLGELLKGLEKGDCRILKRTLLEVAVEDKTYYALNEAAIQRDYGLHLQKPTQILRIDVETGEGKDRISGDGLLICTPTGSTAYSLSAGGAIITPEVPVFMLTPVCAFSMRRRPVVFSNEEEFTLRVARGEGVLLLDGSAVAVLPENAVITVKKAPFTANFPVRESNAFFDKVSNKLNQ